MAKDKSAKKAEKVEKIEGAEAAAAAVDVANNAASAATVAAADTAAAGSEQVAAVEDKKADPEPEKKKSEAKVVDDGKVAVTVPKAFDLRQQNGLVLRIKAGPQRMALEVFDHEYTKANGVKKV